MTNEYEDHNCEFKNPSECEQELEEKGVKMEDAEEETYGE